MQGDVQKDGRHPRLYRIYTNPFNPTTLVGADHMSPRHASPKRDGSKCPGKVALNRCIANLILDLPVTIPGFVIRQFWHERFHRDPANKWFRDLIYSLVAPGDDARNMGTLTVHSPRS
jgi:hypothetical protein